MNILITTSIFPPDIGGPARSVALIASELSRRGHRVCVVTLSDSLRLDDSGYCFQVIRIGRTFLPLRLLEMVLMILSLGKKVDLLFVNGRFLEAAVANVVLRKPLVRKVVGDWAWEQATIKRWVKDSFEDFQKKRYGLRVTSLKALRTWWTCRADRVIVDSYYLSRWVKDWGVPEEQIIVIHNAVEPVERIEGITVPLSTPIRVVMVGALLRQKRVDQVIQVVLLLDGVGLVVVGEGPERPHLEQLARTLGCADRIYFTGQRRYQDVLALMAACDIFVLNSMHESFPHVVLEAMSVGLPVVVTAVGGVPEIVKDSINGYVIPVSSETALQKALVELVASLSTRRILAAGAKQTVEQFSLAQMVEETETVLAAALTR